MSSRLPLRGSNAPQGILARMEGILDAGRSFDPYNGELMDEPCPCCDELHCHCFIDYAEGSDPESGPWGEWVCFDHSRRVG